MKNIFISSTFIDMQAERDMVQERVLPVLREEARKYGDNVGVIDLRWGVDTSTLETEEGAAKVLKVCLDEIDRSHPYMLIFLGERYGTMMREEQIKKSIRGREDRYTTDDYIKSITALEIEYGALAEKYGELNHCVVCFREPVIYLLDGTEKELYAEHTEEGKRKLEALKERIKHDFGDNNRLITYSCTWDKSSRQLVDFVSNGQPLEKVLINCFVELFHEGWKEYENLSWQDKEQLGFRALMESKLRSFVGREELLEEYYQSTVKGTHPIILQGETGSGKTAIMCKLTERLQKEGKNVFSFFSGVGSMSNNAESLVKQMVYYMENLLHIEDRFGETEIESKADNIKGMVIHSTQKSVQYDDRMEYLEDLCARLPEKEKVYFCIDAMDQLFRDEHVEKLDFFVKGKNVQMLASCTDEFELPMEAMVSREVKFIPALSKADAKAVAEGIFASYSRNVYVAIEEEILKKKSIGNPLYISLLVQRLNMMDIEELGKAMTEDEIISFGLNIVREMPEDIEDAIVAVIFNGIIKLSESGELLKEVLQYLAISRQGLRMWDLQEIFTGQKKELPVIDVTLLMKYLDGFFYVHEDDRIDFTHKVIRQGLLKRITEKEAKEKAIKEHLKGMQEKDVLRMQEGMYFARICKDEEFAKELIERAYLKSEEDLVKAIKEEAVEDGGDFYCRLIEAETQEESLVRDFFLWSLPKQLGLVKEEMHTKLVLGEVLVKNAEELYKKGGSEESLWDLCIGYSNIGNALCDYGQSGEALVYFKQNLKYTEALYAQKESEVVLFVLFISYRNMGRALMGLGQSGEALSYFKKSLKCADNLYVKEKSKEYLWVLFDSYRNMGNALRSLGELNEALVCFKKSLKWTKEWHEKGGSEKSFMGVANAYNCMGNVLSDLGESSEALSYFKKSLKCVEELHEKKESEESLRDLATVYNDMGNALSDSGESREALTYYRNALKIDEELHGRTESEASLFKLADTYINIGDTLKYLGEPSEALSYLKKSLKINKELYEKQGNEVRFQNLSTNYNAIGRALIDLDKPSESLTYLEKSLEIREELHEKAGSETSRQDLFSGYNNMGEALSDLGQSREALSYYEKSLKYAEDLHKKRKSVKSLQDLSTSYSNIGHVLRDLGEPSEALIYFKKGLKCTEELYEKQGDEVSLGYLSINNDNIGNVLRDLGKLSEALLYYKKSIRYAEERHVKYGGEENLQYLSDDYNHMGYVLRELGELNEALVYLKKSLKCREELHEKNGSEASLENLADVYISIGEALSDLGELSEALLYYKKSIKYAEELHEKYGGEKNLWYLWVNYSYIGFTLNGLGELREALSYHEKAIQCKEELHKNRRNEADLRHLANCYDYIGSMLRDLDQPRKALLYYEKAIQCKEELYEQSRSEESLKELSIDYDIVGHILSNLGQTREGLTYLEKVLRCKEELHERKGSAESLYELYYGYDNVGWALMTLGQKSEAILYLDKALEIEEKLFK